MTGEATLELPPERGLFVPRGAIVESGDATYVFARQGTGRFVPRKIERGAAFGDLIAVTRGLAAGEEVVTSGSFLVDAESRLQAALQVSP
jgi:Cu(I)/Ag(I) efflux system membrane fusion protein